MARKSCLLNVSRGAGHDRPDSSQRPRRSQPFSGPTPVPSGLIVPSPDHGTLSLVQRRIRTRCGPAARLKAELERAQEQLRAVKAGSRPASAAPAAAPTPIRSGLGSGRTPQEFAAIRDWARANGHKIANKGMVPKKVQEAYDAANQAPARKAS